MKEMKDDEIIDGISQFILARP